MQPTSSARMSIPPNATSYRDLVAWRKAFRYMGQLYQLTRELPAQERFGLSSQLRRAALSIPANIAEGYGRRSTKEYVYHLRIAVASAFEAETLVLAAESLGYASKARIEGLMALGTDVQALLNGLVNSLRRKDAR